MTRHADDYRLRECAAFVNTFISYSFVIVESSDDVWENRIVKSNHGMREGGVKAQEGVSCYSNGSTD